MTYCSNELREKGVSETIIAWRKWRRAMRLPQREAAAMADVDYWSLLALESGRRQPRQFTVDKLTKLMERWIRAGWPRRPETRGRPCKRKP